MKKTTKPGIGWHLKDALESAGFEANRYSGRGMYGEECLAVDCDSIEEVIDAVTDQIYQSVDKVIRKPLLQLLRSRRTDNLGRGYVVYWPQVKWEDSWGDGLGSSDEG